MFVEGAAQRAILLAHVDFELAGGAAAFPTVVGVAHTEILLRGSEGQAALGKKLEVEESEEQASEMGKIGNAALARWRQYRNAADRSAASRDGRDEIRAKTRSQGATKRRYC